MVNVVPDVVPVTVEEAESKLPGEPELSAYITAWLFAPADVAPGTQETELIVPAAGAVYFLRKSVFAPGALVDVMPWNAALAPNTAAPKLQLTELSAFTVFVSTRTEPL